ncbi:hypothetical protein ABZT51_35470 [Streptomyces sp. NPDC005373]
MTARPHIRITSMRPEHADAVLKIYLLILASDPAFTPGVKAISGRL